MFWPIINFQKPLPQVHSLSLTFNSNQQRSFAGLGSISDQAGVFSTVLILEFTQLQVRLQERPPSLK